MQVLMDRLTKSELLQPPEGEISATIRSRVEAARALQHERYGTASRTNGSANLKPDRGLLSSNAIAMLEDAIDHLALTGRGCSRVVRVARTIADLAGRERVEEGDVTDALALRLDREKQRVS